MVTLSLVRDNSKFGMRRSKTSVQLKPNAQRRSSGPVRSSRFWNAAQLKDNLARSSLQTAQYDSTNNRSMRRRSIDCTYHIQIAKLSDTTEGMKNLRIFDMPPNSREELGRTKHMFPPISNKSLKNPRLLSAKSTSKSEKCGPKKPENLKLTNNHVAEPAEVIFSARTSNSDMCHGLPNYSDNIEQEDEPKHIFSFGKFANQMNEDTSRITHTRASRLKASSLHSRSSESSSCNSAAYRARFASRRRLSLPVNPSSFPGKSKEFHKAIQEISRQTDDSNGGLKRSQTATSTLTISDKVSTPHSSSTNRDAGGSLSILSNHRRDSLQRIEEAPVERSTPFFTLNEESKGDVESGPERVPCFENGVTSLNSDGIIKFSSGDESEIVKDSEKYLTSEMTDQQSLKSETNGEQYDINANEIPPHENVKTISKIIEDEQVLPSNNATSKLLIEFNSDIDDDESIIDASVLNEPDENLCDADFHEKRMIQWILSAETGDQVDQDVQSVISPSPTNGSRETAITVIYSGK